MMNGFRPASSTEMFGSAGALNKGRISSLRVLGGYSVQNQRRYSAINSAAAEAIRSSKPGIALHMIGSYA